MNDRPLAPRFPIVAWAERRSRRQRLLALGVVVLFVVWRTVGGLAGLLLDRWWFDATTDAEVWSTRTTAQAILVAIAFVGSVAILGGTIWLVLRAGERVLAPVNRALRWYHDRMGPAHRWMLVTIGIWAVWTITTTAPSYWQEWLLWLHGDDLGVPVAGTGGDLGDYLFDLPLLMVASSWLRQLVAFSAVVAVFGHAVSGALRFPRQFRSRRVATTHIAVLVGLFLGLQALHYVLVARPSTALDRSGGFVGAGYTLLQVVRPGLWVTAVAALAAAIALIHTVVTRTWRLGTAAVGTWAVVHLAALVVVPLVVEQAVVGPAEGSRQLSAYERNLTATSAAYGLDTVEVVDVTLADGIAAVPSAEAASTLARTPLFDPDRMASSLQVLQGTAGTRITDVDLDRYVVDGVERPVLVAARQPDRGGLPASGWVQEHLVYTHGDGLVLAPADTADADGRPDTSVSADVFDPDYDPSDIAVSASYFGEGLDGWWAVVGTRREQQGGAEYEGEAGVGLGSAWRRVVASVALGDPRLWLSAEVTGSSELLVRRGLTDRLSNLAPFLSWDSDPYPALVDGRVTWIVDGYTTSATYPGSQFYGSAGLPGGSDIARNTLNSVRHAVRAVIDAASGETHLYRASDSDDPILDLWSSILPGLIEPTDAIQPALSAHLRYPNDLFTVQTTLLGRYHVDAAELLFNGSDRWTISPAASSSVDDGGRGDSPSVLVHSALGSDTATWSTIRPFSPGASGRPSAARDHLAGFAVVSNDDPGRLLLVRLEASTARQLSTPQVAQSAVDADPELARAITLLNANGSKVTYGPFVPQVVDGALVWVRSLIVSGTSGTAAPRLQQVVAVSNGVVGSDVSAVEAATAAATRS
ncbi:MAG: hypothetical protein RLZ04_1961 [Actinomycetota bacterium]